MQKIVVITLGCPKNTVEAEYLLGVFQNEGFEIINDVYKADIAVVHTCSFIKSAKKESERYIRNVLDVKKKTGLRVFVSGCLPQLLKEKILGLFPDIDGFVGTGTLDKLHDIIFNKGSDILPLPPGGLNNSYYRLLSSKMPSTYLKIAEGCEHKCSFCIIPTLRGNYKSRTIESVVDEAKVLAENGIKELILVAQDTTSYGNDIYGAFVLDKLLAKLSKIKELKWIRLLYAYPSSVTNDLLKVFEEHKNICNYMDIPIQHSSKSILSKMKRPLNTVAVIEKIKNILPDIVLRTSIITGFPGEGEKDVNELINFLNQGYFLYVGVFEYSNQKEADSFKLQGHIDTFTAKKRRTLIEKAQYEIFRSKIFQKRDNVIDFFVENCSKKGNNKYHIEGRSYFQSPEIDGKIVLTSDKPIDVYQFRKIKIKGINGYNIRASFFD